MLFHYRFGSELRTIIISVLDGNRYRMNDSIVLFSPGTYHKTYELSNQITKITFYFKFQIFLCLSLQGHDLKISEHFLLNVFGGQNV